MRNISAVSLAKIQAENGSEPIIVVRVFWNGLPTSYCDKKNEEEGLVGKLIEISGIEDVINIDESATSVSLDVTLDDTDGSIKSIFDQTDIHKTYVQVLQWFEGIPLAEAFLIFEGEISSPIVWSEGVRTLAFNVITQLEDREVGFSAEEGKFDFLPNDLIGVSWPIVFGNVFAIKALPLMQAPSIILAQGFGVVNDDLWTLELQAISLAMAAARLEGEEADRQFAIATRAGAIHRASPPFGTGDVDQANQYAATADGYYQQGLSYLEQITNMQSDLALKTAEYALQKESERRTLPIAQSNVPSGTTFTAEINGWTATATVAANTITFSNLEPIPAANERVGTNNFTFNNSGVDVFRIEIDDIPKYTWFDGGSTVKMFNFPQHYIVSIGHVAVVNVFGRGKYGRAVIPPNYYTVVYETFNNLLVTKLVFATPLSSRPGEWEDGNIEIDTVSALTNVVDIMEWAITTYSELTFDATSFAYVKAKLTNYPANFALTERKNLVEFLQDLAFQSRCSIWVNDRKFYLRFLPEDIAATESIVDSDVQVDSLTITATETERLVTKYVALWRDRPDGEPNKIIYRHNIEKYGTIEEEYDYYIYNNYESVAIAAQFWLIRKANSWKLINCKLLLHKLRIETFDPVSVEFNGNLVANEAVTGMVLSSKYNPNDDNLDVQIWLPVRLGEMTKYKFAFPFTVTDVFPEISDPNIQTGNPFADAIGDLVPNPLATFSRRGIVIRYGAGSYTQGFGQVIGDQTQTAPLGSLVVTLDPNEIDQTRPLGLTAYNNSNIYKVNKVVAQATPTPVTANTFFGTVLAKAGDFEYTCNVYTKGLYNAPVEQNVLMGALDSTLTLDEGYPLVVNRTVFVGDNGEYYYEYWSQPPVWRPLSES